MKRRVLITFGALLLVAAGLGFWQRMSILSWLCVNRLAAASDEEQALWAERVAGLEQDAVPWVLRQLHSDEARVCSNMETVLALHARGWGGSDPRSEALLEELQHHFPNFSPAGKQSALRFPIELFKSQTGKPTSATLTLGAGKLLEAASKDAATDDGPALRLASQISERVPQGQWHDTCRSMAMRGLDDVKPANRVLAIHLSLSPAFADDEAVLGKIVPLLRDADARVRSAALVAVGASKDLATDDDLLPMLHDADDKVRRLCEVALRSRGLPDDHLLLARLVSDTRPAARLEVFNYLSRADNLEPGIWLKRLSQDKSPAVRAAAIRTAFAQQRTDMRERIRHMAATDESPTVRQIAAHYLARLAP